MLELYNELIQEGYAIVAVIENTLVNIHMTKGKKTVIFLEEQQNYELLVDIQELISMQDEARVIKIDQNQFNQLKGYKK